MFRHLRREGKNKDAEKALENAEKNLERIKERTPEVETLVQRLKYIRERNHFSEQIETIMRQGRSQHGA